MQHGSFHNLLAGNRPDYVPTVGDGATELLWTDRHAYTVIAVADNGKSCTVQRDKVTRTDKNGMSECQSYAYEADKTGTTVVVRKTKKGWYAGTRKFAFGSRREYHDFSF
jgi:hypothetical protein